MLEMSKRGKILQGPPLWAVAAVRKADLEIFVFGVIMAVYLPCRRLRASTSKIDLHGGLCWIVPCIKHASSGQISWHDWMKRCERGTL